MHDSFQGGIEKRKR